MAFGISTPFGGFNKSADPQKKVSFSGTGITDPVQALKSQLNLMDALMQKLNMKGPSRLSSHAPTGMPAAPVHVPGVPFQIGGGLGSDPAAPSPDPSQAIAGLTPNDPFENVLENTGIPSGPGNTSGRFAGEDVRNASVQRRKP